MHLSRFFFNQIYFRYRSKSGWTYWKPIPKTTQNRNIIFIYAISYLLSQMISSMYDTSFLDMYWSRHYFCDVASSLVTPWKSALPYHHYTIVATIFIYVVRFFYSSHNPFYNQSRSLLISSTHCLQVLSNLWKWISYNSLAQIF